MANQGRPKRGAGRGTSFGKRQGADDDFRNKRKREGGQYKKKDEGGDERPSRSKGGKFISSRPSGGARFSRRTDERPARDDNRSRGGSEGRGEGRGERRGFGGRSEERGRGGFGARRGSSYEGGRRKFSGGRDERREPRNEEGGFKKKSFGGPRRERSEGSGEFKREYKKDFKKREPRERKSFIEGKVEKHKARVEKPAQETEANKDGLIRLNKFISNSGVCSRREADDLIKMGLVSVNGVTVTEMGHKVKPTDDVRYEGKKLTAERPVYILLNKPKGFITTTDDPQERNTVMELIAGACKERVYPVGRLDRNTTGLLLLTNDGDLTDKLTHPSFNAKKIYKVELDRPLTKDDFQKILDGISLDEGKAIVDDLAIVSDDGKTVGIELHIGWNHIVRRIFDALQYSVVKLDRVVYAGLDKKDLKRGQWRFLKTDEIVRLKHFK